MTNILPHVVLLTTWQYNNSAEGVSRVLSNMANALSKRGYCITVLYCDENEGTPFFPINSSVRLVNCYKKNLYNHAFLKTFFSLSLNPTKRKSKRDLYECNWKAALIKQALFDLPSIDLFIAFQSESTFILRSILGIKTPIITMCHNAPSIFITPPRFAQFIPALESSNAVQVLMPSYIKEARLSLKEPPIIYIPNTAPVFEQASTLSNKKIICVSRFDEKKRPELLIDSFKIIKERYPDWKLEFYGRLERRSKYYQDLIIKYNISDSFFLCGTTNQIYEKLINSSIFVLPSKYEGFSIALAEAMAAGLPVVACNDCTSVCDLIVNGTNGILTAPTPEKFADGIIQLIANFELRKRIGHEARKFALNFSENHVWSEWDALIRNVIRT